jgi:hypothetical protein
MTARFREGGQSAPPVLGIGAPYDQTSRLEPVDGVRHAGRIDLQAFSDDAQGQVSKL